MKSFGVFWYFPAKEICQYQDTPIHYSRLYISDDTLKHVDMLKYQSNIPKVIWWTGISGTWRWLKKWLPDMKQNHTFCWCIWLIDSWSLPFAQNVQVFFIIMHYSNIRRKNWKNVLLDYSNMASFISVRIMLQLWWREKWKSLVKMHKNFKCTTPRPTAKGTV